VTSIRDCQAQIDQAGPSAPASAFSALALSCYIIPALLAALVAVSLVGAALSPGNQSFEAKWADWLRAHHAGLVAQRFEEIYYSARQPPRT
jgi:hypothetical protein